MGQSYHPIDLNDNIDVLKVEAQNLDNQGARWYIDDTDGNIHMYGKFQKAYIDMVLDNAKNSEEAQMVSSDDPMVTKVLEGHGIEVVSSNEMISRLTGKSVDEVSEMTKDVDPSNLTPEEKERVLKTFKEWQEKGILKTYNEKGSENEKIN